MSELRWRLADDERDGQPALFDVDNLVGPQRGTGSLSGMEFLHVAARRILNRVPAGSRMPMHWTINAYRGCSHACLYCMAPDTPVLMADGRTKPISDLRVGDRIYGTERRGNYRRYVPTEVLAHWRTIKPAYRIELEDGTSLVASADHRFLTNRGWKHVTGRDENGRQRPHLTTTNELLGVGSLADPPKQSDSYRQGYLTGMIRGDAHLGAYYYRRPGRLHGTVFRFRLALADLEALDRAAEFLASFGIRTTRFAFTPKTERHREMAGIRASSRASYFAILNLIEWPREPDHEWQLGFLAGIFDAEGSAAPVIRISNKDPEILGRTAGALGTFGFDHMLEGPNAIGCFTVRIRGGFAERLRFFHLTDPAITRKLTFDGLAIKSDARLRVVEVRPLGIEIPMYDITTRTGDFIANGVVSHNCFARPTHEYLGLNLGEDFDRKIVVKINAVERLRAELGEPKWQHEAIAMGTNTDPYQRCEGKYKLTRGIVEVLGQHANPFSILTKSPLVVRDLDLLKAAAARAEVSVHFSLGTLDHDAWRATEPGAPDPRRRVDAMARMADAGIDTGALIAPVLPGISDRPEQLAEVVKAIAGAGGRILGASALYLRHGTREHYLDWLAGYDPDLHRRYLDAYRGNAYLRPDYSQWLNATIARLAEEHGART